jgi:hypothetical protein
VTVGLFALCSNLTSLEKRSRPFSPEDVAFDEMLSLVLVAAIA